MFGKSIFYCLFGASGGFIFGFVIVDIVIYVVVSWVSWKWYVYIMGEIHKVLGSLIIKEKDLNDMI